MRKNAIIVIVAVGIGTAIGSLYLLNRRGAEQQVAASKLQNEPSKPKQNYEAHLDQSTKQLAPTATAGTDRSVASAVKSEPFDEVQQDADLIKALSLSESDANKFLQILSDQQRKIQELVRKGSGTFAGDPAADSIRSDTDRQLEELFGDQKFNEYKEYRKYEAEHRRISRLNAQLGEMGQTKLGEDQQQWLFAVMKEERDRISPPLSSGFGSAIEFVNATKQWRSEIERRILNRAAVMLTPAQLDIFQKLGK